MHKDSRAVFMLGGKMSLVDKMKMPNKKHVRQFVNIKSIKDDGILETYTQGSQIFFKLPPSNLNVQSTSNVYKKIKDLANVLKEGYDIEFICMNASQQFNSNKEFLMKINETETRPVIYDMNNQDIQFFDKIQENTAASRDFLIKLSFPKLMTKESRADKIQSVQQLFFDNNILVDQCSKKTVKRIMKMYYQQDIEEEFDDVDGERWIDDTSILYITEEGKKEEKEHNQKSLKKKSRKGKEMSPEKQEQLITQSFIDGAMPSPIQFMFDYYRFDNTYRAVWVIRSYQAETDKVALLSRLGERSDVTLKIYTSPLPVYKQNQIVEKAIKASITTANENTSKFLQKRKAKNKIVSTDEVMTQMDKDHEKLSYCTIFIEMIASSMGELKKIKQDVKSKTMGAKMEVNHLGGKQKEGYISVNPFGRNVFEEQYRRVLPATSIANLYPFSYSGKTDVKGAYLGKDKNGTHIIYDLDKRTSDVTNSNMLIIGNSGEGKTYLTKMIILSKLQRKKSVLLLDVEYEYRFFTEKAGGTYMNMMSGDYLINLLEPRYWNISDDTPDGTDTPKAFENKTAVSQHISYLRDFFRSYKPDIFKGILLDILEMFISKLYKNFGITDKTDLRKLKPADFPILEDLYYLVDKDFQNFESQNNPLYEKQFLATLLLGLRSICIESDSIYFNGYTNIESYDFISFGVRDLMTASENLKNAMLFNILNYISHRALIDGDCCCVIDELHVYLSNMIAVNYILNMEKRVRKKESDLILATQNINDFLRDDIAEYTKPLFAIPSYRFLFHSGRVDERAFKNLLMLEDSEFNVIRGPELGKCLFSAGNERYVLKVSAPEHKEPYLKKVIG